MEIRKIRGKKAQEGGVSISLLALIVAVALLVIIFFFITDAFGLRSRLMGSVGKSNVDQVMRDCTSFCVQQAKYNYDLRQEVILADPAKTTLSASCRELEGTRDNGCLIGGAGNVDVSNIKVAVKSECTKPVWQKDGSTTLSGCYIVGTSTALSDVTQSTTCVAEFKDGKCMVNSKDVSQTQEKCAVVWNSGGKCLMGKNTDISGISSSADCAKITATWIGAFSQPIITTQCSTI